MLNTFVSYTDDPDTEDAIAAILEDMDRQLSGQRPDAAILFAGIDFAHQYVIDEIRKHFPGVELVGCTTAGEMAGGMGFGKDALVLTLFVSDDVEIRSGIGKSLSGNVDQAIADAVAQARAKMSHAPTLCVTFPDSLTVSGSAIVNGFNAALGSGFPIVGGTAGDYTRFSQTMQFHNDEVLSDSVPILLLGGNYIFGHGLASGWNPVGKQGTVTASSGASVHAIDDQKATEFYLNYIPSLDRPNEYPMAIFEENDPNLFYLRSPILATPETGEMRFFGEVPTNATVQCTITTKEEVLSSVKETMNKATAMYPGKNPKLALLFSCGGRHMYLGSRTKEEFDKATGSFTGSPPAIAGFYSYGEIAPLEKDSITRFHNTTFIALLLGQD